MAAEAAETAVAGRTCEATETAELLGFWVAWVLRAWVAGLPSCWRAERLGYLMSGRLGRQLRDDAT